MSKLIKITMVAIAALALTGTTASASQNPGYHKLYNHRDSWTGIDGFSGPNCTGPSSWLLHPGQSVSMGRSYRTTRPSKYKIGRYGQYHRVDRFVCVTAPANSTYMSVHVF